MPIMKNIISVSRRTDVPAHYADWFINRLKQGYVFVKHPYTKEIFHVSLKQEDISGIVFWSKNFSPLLPKIDEIETITDNLFFHFTITGMSKDIEMNAPPYHEAVQDLVFIAERYSPENVIWRFDPICITDKISFEEHMGSFRKCVEMVKGNVTACYISFVHPYTKVIRNFEKYTNHTLLDITVEEKRSYAKQLAQIADQYGIKLFACCNDYLLPETIDKGRCINKNDLSRVWGYELQPYEKSSPTRKECGCTRSIDIGAYDTCPHGCIYCYANTDKEKSVSFHRTLNTDWNALNMNIDVDEYFGARYSLFQ